MPGLVDRNLDWVAKPPSSAGREWAKSSDRQWQRSGCPVCIAEVNVYWWILSLTTDDPFSTTGTAELAANATSRSMMNAQLSLEHADED
ncbi:MAG: hypothetical protein AB8B50_00995 [Pirellulaceae bacterium]